ncbi:MAG: hypothetical protein ACPL7M_01075 [Bryobacteraceae bacterium]
MLLSLPAAQPELSSDPWKLVHPQAKWILAVDWTRAKNSPAGRILSRQLAGAETRLEASGLGLQAVTTLERIIASGVAIDVSDHASAEGMVVAVEGVIDRTRLKKGLPPGTAMEKFRGADLFVPPKAKPEEPLMAVVANRLLLIGDRASLALILERKGGIQDPDLYGKASRLAAESEIWLVAAGLEARPGEQAGPGGLDSVRDMELSISLQRGLRLHTVLTADSPEAAQHLAGMTQLAGALGKDGPAAWLRRAQIKNTGNQLALDLDIPASELEAGFEQARAAVREMGQRMLQSVLASATAAGAPDLRPAVRGAPVAVPSPPAPKVRTIRIVGLDEGTKEIRYTAPSDSPF